MTTDISEIRKRVIGEESTLLIGRHINSKGDFKLVGDQTEGILSLKKSDGSLWNTVVHFDEGVVDSGKWDDMTFPATRIRQGATAKPDFDATDLCLLFPQNDATEIAYISEQMRHKWKQGTNIRPHIHWIQEEATLPTWKIDYRFATNGEAFSDWTTGVAQTGEAFTYVSGSIVQISMFPEIDMSAYVDSTSLIFNFKIYRDDDDLTGDAKFITFDFHYLIDSFGSNSEYVK